MGFDGLSFRGEGGGSAEDIGGGGDDANVLADQGMVGGVELLIVFAAQVSP